VTRLEHSARALAELRGRLRHDLQVAQLNGAPQRVVDSIVTALQAVIEEESLLLDIHEDGTRCRVGHA
jgi:hypothetical protein